MATLPDLKPLAAAVLMLESATTAFEAAPTATNVEMTDWLDEVRTLVQRVRLCDATVQQKLGAQMRTEPLVIGRQASAEAKYGSSKKSWQHGALKTIAAEKVIEAHVDKETGAFDGAPIAVLLAEILEWPSISGWKSTVAKKYGVNVNNYCEQDQGQYRIIIRSNNETATVEEDE